MLKIMSIVIAAVLVVAIILSIMPLFQSNSIAASIVRLTSNGYIVLAAGEYSTLQAAVDAVKAKTDNLPTNPANEVTAAAAVVNAETAANTANETLNTLLLHNENEVFLFPEETTANITMTSGVGVDTFSAWTEIVDTNAVTLSSKFAADDGYLTEIMTHDYSANATDKKFIIELATANDGTNIIGRIKVRSDWTYVLTLKSVRIGAGDTIYYRMKSEISGAILRSDFRYYYR